MIEALQLKIEQYDLVKATLSKPRDKQSDLRNLFVEQIDQKGSSVYKLTSRFKTKDVTKILDAPALVTYLREALQDQFYNGDFFTSNMHISVLQSKKGKVTWLSKAQDHVRSSSHHNRQKTRLIPPSASWLKDLGIVSDKGKVFSHAQDKYRQINRFAELVQHLMKDDLPPTLKVRDMGSGKGYLTFALHQMLADKGVTVETQGIELRKDLVEVCNGVARDHNMQGLSFIEGSIADYTASACDVVIALHACDVATDMAIAHAVASRAKFIVLAPCCHKQVRKVMSPDSVSMCMLRHGTHMERVAEIVTDSIRSLWLEAHGYQTKVFEWISTEHTGKNVMITARYTGKMRQEALHEIEGLKTRYGVEWQWLERLDQ